jgi:hypothetical protein
MSEWPTVRFEILGHGENAVVLQVDENGMPYTPPPLVFTFEKSTLRLYKADPQEQPGGARTD